MQEFPPNEPEDITLNVVLRYTHHLLRYEAESLFWNVLYWCMTAQPAIPPTDIESEIAEGFQVKLPISLWQNLVGIRDVRNTFFIRCDVLDEACLHPSYCELHPLLDEMRQHFQADPERSKDPLKHHPEYFHEVFQLLIINFLAENAGKPFMGAKRSDTIRDFEPSGIKGKATTAPNPSTPSQPVGIKRSAQAMGSEDGDTDMGPVSTHCLVLVA